MFKNYFIIAFRNLLRQRIFSVLNILGLAIGFTCAILILLYIKNELNVNKNFSNVDHLYRLEGRWKDKDKDWSITSPSGLGPSLVEEYPEVLNYAREAGGAADISYNLNNCRGEFVAADTTFFNLFDLKFLQGNPATALNAPNSMVITEGMAIRLFGKTDVLNTVVKLRYSNPELKNYVITGVLKEAPFNSVTYYGESSGTDIFIPSNNISGFFNGCFYGNWPNTSQVGYIQCADNADVKKIEHNIISLLDKNMPAERRKNYEVRLQPLKDLYFSENGGQNYKIIKILFSLTLIILAIAGVNYINISTARAHVRYKEIGIRKTLGANRKQLIIQFLLESTMISLFALLLSFLFVELSLNSFNQIVGKKLTFDYYTDPFTILTLVGLAISVGIFSGSYPAFLQSSIQPAVIVKGIPQTGKVNIILRKFLVISQFTMTIIFLLFAYIIVMQLNFMLNEKNLGFNKENIIAIPSVPRGDYKSVEILKNKLAAFSEINSVSASWAIPGADADGYKNRADYTCADCPVQSPVSLFTKWGDEDFFKVYQYRLKEGRFFSNDKQPDKEQGVIINEAAANAFGWKSAIGKQIGHRTVIGVTENVYDFSLEKTIHPDIYFFSDNSYRVLSIKLNTGNSAKALEIISKVWKETWPNITMDYSFIDENMKRLYTNEFRIKKVVSAAAAASLFIACLGLIGLLAINLSIRKKELGIRKIMGASLQNIITLISKDFVKLILLSALIAFPVAYYLVNHWLNNYAYSIEINFWIFPVILLLVLIIALTTILFQIIKTARENPVISLRHE